MKKLFITSVLVLMISGFIFIPQAFSQSHSAELTIGMSSFNLFMTEESSYDPNTDTTTGYTLLTYVTAPITLDFNIRFGSSTFYLGVYSGIYFFADGGPHIPVFLMPRIDIKAGEDVYIPVFVVGGILFPFNDTAWGWFGGAVGSGIKVDINDVIAFRVLLSIKTSFIEWGFGVDMGLVFKI